VPRTDPYSRYRRKTNILYASIKHPFIVCPYLNLKTVSRSNFSSDHGAEGTRPYETHAMIQKGASDFYDPD
jgi:hypothetical protein